MSIDLKININSNKFNFAVCIVMHTVTLRYIRSEIIPGIRIECFCVCVWKERKKKIVLKGITAEAAAFCTQKKLRNRFEKEKRTNDTVARLA